MLTLLAISIAAYIVVWLAKESRSGVAVALSLIFGGALGNIIDRVVFGYVIDFIDFYIGSWHWYVFNIADSAICLGVIGLMALLWHEDKEQ